MTSTPASSTSPAAAPPVRDLAGPDRLGKPMALLAAAAPLAVAGGLLAIYLASPAFYLRWVLEYRQREYQAVEFATTGLAVLAGLILLVSAWRLWRVVPSLLESDAPGQGGKWHGLLHDRGAAVLVAVVGLAALGFAGEESSWGQTYLGWQTPERYAQISGETNLHNADLLISVQSLGSLFLCGVFFAVPVLWALGRLPRPWAPAIPEWPVAFSLAVAFLWKGWKEIYREMYDTKVEATRFYIDFVEQINEHKELLIAVTLLMYALYRLSALRRLKRMTR